MDEREKWLTWYCRHTIDCTCEVCIEIRAVIDEEERHG